MLILNIYMSKMGYPDDQIAYFTSFRFLGVLLFAFPMGLFIKGKRLKPFFVISAIVIPLSSLLMIEAVQIGNMLLLKSCFFGWGFGMMLMQVCVLPFIMRNAPEASLSESISLNFSTWSSALLIAGFTIAMLSSFGNFSALGITFPWDEYHILKVIIILSTLSTALLLKIEEVKPPPVTRTGLTSLFDYDWDLIFKSVVPTILIAVGAGLTIPFINLFFFNVFGIDSEQFSLIGSATAILVFSAALTVPLIRRKFGYKIAITLSQALSIFFLVMMALTELVADVPGVVFVAILCYIFRQPLMNMANPMTSELVMKYVGEKNQELISALTSSIWSGSWFISAKIFQYLRAMNLPYYRIFLITAGLYCIGVVLYYLLILDYQRREVLLKRIEHASPTH